MRKKKNKSKRNFEINIFDECGFKITSLNQIRFGVVFVKLQPIKVIELNLFNWVKSPNWSRPRSGRAKPIRVDES